MAGASSAVMMSFDLFANHSFEAAFLAAAVPTAFAPIDACSSEMKMNDQG